MSEPSTTNQPMVRWFLQGASVAFAWHEFVERTGVVRYTAVVGLAFGALTFSVGMATGAGIVGVPVLLFICLSAGLIVAAFHWTATVFGHRALKKYLAGEDPKKGILPILCAIVVLGLLAAIFVPRLAQHHLSAESRCMQAGGTFSFETKTCEHPKGSK